MIRSYKHKGLKLLGEKGDGKALGEYADRCEQILSLLDIASSPDDLRLPGLRPHALTGDRRGYWSVTVRANWRIVFRFEGEDVVDVELVDYH